MRAVLQRVKKATVKFAEVVEEISRGLVVFVAVGKEDDITDIEWLAKKIVNLRIFENEEGKFDRSVLDIHGEILVVSEFTLYGDCKKGNRPDFSSAQKPDIAQQLYERFVEELKKFPVLVKTGKFKENMLVEIHNDGPVTLILDTSTK